MLKYIIWLFLLMLPFTGYAQDSKIAAVVNDMVITSNDVADRLNLTIKASSLPDTTPARQQLAPSVLRSLIDDQLKLQAAQKNKVTVSNNEIAVAFEQIAKQNDMTADQFSQVIESTGVSRSSMDAQLRADVAWHKYIEQRVVPRIEIPDAEIDRTFIKLQQDAGKTEYLVAEIFLPVENAADADKTQAFGKNLISQLGNGAKFPQLARNFSGNAAASRGGDLGWVMTGQLALELERALRVMQPGQISVPLRTLRGYHILYLRDKRTLAKEKVPDRVGVKNILLNQKTDLMQRAELRDLKRQAFIEIRG